MSRKSRKQQLEELRRVVDFNNWQIEHGRFQVWAMLGKPHPYTRRATLDRAKIIANTMTTTAVKAWVVDLETGATVYAITPVELRRLRELAQWVQLERREAWLMWCAGKAWEVRLSKTV